MNNRYSINEINICTFNVEGNTVIPNLKKYPQTRLCVIDNKLKIYLKRRYNL